MWPSHRGMGWLGMVATEKAKPHHYIIYPEASQGSPTTLGNPILVLGRWALKPRAGLN